MVFGTFCVIFSIYYYVQQRTPVKAEWWLKNVYDIKEHYSKAHDGKKIVILGGSNSLFGINSKVLEQRTGFHVLNLSSHMWLDLDFHLFKLKQFINDGDIVIMPLEFEYYSYSNEASSWFNNNMIAWGDDYLDQLSLDSYLKFLISTPANRLFGLMMIKNAPKFLTSEEAIDELERLLKYEGEKWRGYSYKSMNLSGDINVDEMATQEVLSEFVNGFDYYKTDISISQNFLDGWKKIEELVNAYNGKLILTWPATIRRGISDLSLAENQVKVDVYKEALEKNDIKIYCKPELFNFDINFFFDTQYHLNKNGAKIRSENLSLCLKNILTN